METHSPVKRCFSNRLVHKSACVFFLLFFIFFSLAAPIIAQIGSILFIFALGVFASIFHNVPEDQVLPPEPVSAIYAEHIPTASNNCVEPTEEFVSLEFKSLFTADFPEKCQQKQYPQTVCNSVAPIACLYLNIPVRAGPC